jgi:hypothetical protein
LFVLFDAAASEIDSSLADGMMGLSIATTLVEEDDDPDKGVFDSVVVL